MTRVETAASLQGHLDAYNHAYESQDVSLADMAKAGLAMLREASRLVSAASADSDVTPKQRANAATILRELGEA